MFKPSKYEMETIITSNEADAECSVYTYNSALKRRLKAFAEKCPECCRLKSETPDGSETYIVDKARMSISFKAPLSEDEKQKRRDLAKAQGFGRTKA